MARSHRSSADPGFAALALRSLRRASSLVPLVLAPSCLVTVDGTWPSRWNGDPSVVDGEAGCDRDTF